MYESSLQLANKVLGPVWECSLENARLRKPAMFGPFPNRRLKRQDPIRIAGCCDAVIVGLTICRRRVYGEASYGPLGLADFALPEDITGARSACTSVMRHRPSIVSPLCGVRSRGELFTQNGQRWRNARSSLQSAQRVAVPLRPTGVNQPTLSVYSSTFRTVTPLEM